MTKHITCSYYSGTNLSWKADGKEVPLLRGELAAIHLQNKYTIEKTDFWTISKYSIINHCLYSTSIKVNKILDHFLPVAHRTGLYAHYWFPGNPSAISSPTNLHYSSSNKSCLCEYAIIHTTTVKKLQGSEILLYLSANKWVCHNFIDDWNHRLSHVWLFETPWTVDCQDHLFMAFSRQEYLSG